MSELEEIVRTACPRDCYDTCGVTVHKRNGVIESVRGDPAHFVSQGQLCTKCSIGYNNEWLDPRSRLTRPLRRIGRKGEGRFEPVSWEVAIAAIADRLKRIAASTGPQAILNTHYSGTISLIAYLFPTRFFNRLGATEVSPDTICNMAGHVALHYVYGTSVSGFDPRTGDAAACILVWGANPSASGPHVQEHWIEKLPGKVVVIDPVRTASAEAADIHLQPFPGSDAALAFSMLHVIQREGLVDRDFVAQHTVGWDELEPMLAPCTPAWGEAADRRARPPDRGDRAALWPGTVAAVDGAGAPAPADRRQRDARVLDSSGDYRKYRQARHRFRLPEFRHGATRDRRRVSDRAASEQGRPAVNQPDGSRRLP